MNYEKIWSDLSYEEQWEIRLAENKGKEIEAFVEGMEAGSWFLKGNIKGSYDGFGIYRIKPGQDEEDIFEVLAR